MDRLAHARPAVGDDTLAEATARLQKVRFPKFGLLAIGGLCLLAAVLVPVVKNAKLELVRLNPVHRSFRTTWGFEQRFEQRIAAGLDKEQRLFLLANTRVSEDAGVLRWLESPDDEAYPELREEALAVLQEGHSKKLLPTLQLRAGQATDNGLWPLLEARNWSRDSAGRMPGGGVLQVRIFKPGNFRKSVSLLEEAAAKPVIESELPAHTLRRLGMLGEIETIADQAEQRHFLQLQRNLASFDQGRNRLQEIWVARGEELAKSRDKEGWKKWTQGWLRLSTTPVLWNDLNEALSELGNIGKTIECFRAQALALGLSDEVARMDRLKKVSDSSAPPPTGPPPLSVSGPVRYPSSIAAGLVRPRTHAARPGTVPEEDFKAGRLAEHALADRLLALAAALLFGVMALLAMLEGWRRLPAQRGLAAGLVPLFRRVDFAWIGSLGILLPLAWHVVIVRFTPLGCRDYALLHWDLMLALQQAGGSSLFACCMLLQSARWRIAKRAGILGMRPARLWDGWIMAGIAACFVPVIGCVRYLTLRQEEFMVLGTAAAGFPLLWWVWRVIMAACQPQASSLGGVLVSRLLLPLFTAAAALCLLLMIPLHAEEKRWVREDKLGGADPAGSTLQAVDAAAFAKVRQDLQAAW
ncbi:hypothetical protein [Luteolibacter sp. Populi]|uniref:hypothetical protein n=1 Tax=Luteolibacter sp. Populi TaxID=3230487 RepID=UPI0034675E53